MDCQKSFDVFIEGRKKRVLYGLILWALWKLDTPNTTYKFSLQSNLLLLHFYIWLFFYRATVCPFINLSSLWKLISKTRFQQDSSVSCPEPTDPVVFTSFVSPFALFLSFLFVQLAGSGSAAVVLWQRCWARHDPEMFLIVKYVDGAGAYYVIMLSGRLFTRTSSSHILPFSWRMNRRRKRPRLASSIDRCTR